MQPAACMPAQGVQSAAGLPTHRHTPRKRLSQWQALCHQPCRFPHSSRVTQQPATTAQLTSSSPQSPPLWSHSSRPCHLCSLRHSAVTVGHDAIGSIGSRQQQSQLGSTGGGRHRRRRSCSTVAKARPPRMRGQACDLRERPRSTALPAVDWRRYHLNVLFVDRSAPVS